MRLIIQPDAGAKPLIDAIDHAAKNIEIAIFRFDHTEIKHALNKAVARGVSVRALIANTNHGEENELRQLEMDLLAEGIEVARTASDLLRYHYKFLVIDRKVLYLLTFNYTYLDFGSRSFGIISDDPDLVEEAVNLFEADLGRRPFSPTLDSFVVSPIDGRQKLSGFIRSAEHELLIYDPEISDRRMIQLLRDRVKAGVAVRVIGHVGKPARQVLLHESMKTRFHTRCMIRDRREAFIGSQSLREAELDRRRELGLIIQDAHVVRSIGEVFESDWAISAPAARSARSGAGSGQITPSERVAKAVVRALPLEPLVESALKHALRGIPETRVTGTRLEHQLEDSLRQAVEDTVSNFVRDTIRTRAQP